MRSTAFTVFLLVAALLASGLAGWRLAEGNLDALFGVPPEPVGSRLYRSFAAEDVARIRISSPGFDGEFVKNGAAWEGTRPWQDRVDPRAAFGVIAFTLSMRVEDVAPRDEVDLEKIGLSPEPVQVHLEDATGGTLARYRLGRLAPWQAEDSETGRAIETVYVQPRDGDRKGHIYICAGNILDLFKESGRHLRDHHPFFFHPAALERIRIRGPEGELTLGRETPESPWRIVKPLELRTDPAAMKALLEGLFELRAVRVLDRSAVTLPQASGGPVPRQIALTNFGSEEETVLEIHPPDPPEAREALATVSDRPGTVFELPVKSESGRLSLAELPLSADDLRDPTLANLDFKALSEIGIWSATGADIRIVLRPPRVAIDGKIYPANEERLLELLRVVTSTRAIGFETDAATDLSPWGLDRPVLRLAFAGDGGASLALHFGIDLHGNVYAHRPGTTSVVKVPADLLSSVSVDPYEWRHARLWNVNRYFLEKIERTAADGGASTLAYDGFYESWNAGDAGVVEPSAANALLKTIENLNVIRWLAPGDAGASIALEEPVFSLAITEREEDDTGDEIGKIRREIQLAPAPGSTPPAYYYGRLTGEPQPFQIDRQTFENLAVDVLADG